MFYYLFLSHLRKMLSFCMCNYKCMLAGLWNLCRPPKNDKELSYMHSRCISGCICKGGIYRRFLEYSLLVYRVCKYTWFVCLDIQWLDTMATCKEKIHCRHILGKIPYLYVKGWMYVWTYKSYMQGTMYKVAGYTFGGARGHTKVNVCELYIHDIQWRVQRFRYKG